jgi:hypothetical protein
MTSLDEYYIALIAFGLMVDHFVVWPAFIRRSQRDPYSARLWLWTVLGVIAMDNDSGRTRALGVA